MPASPSRPIRGNCSTRLQLPSRPCSPPSGRHVEHNRSGFMVSMRVSTGYGIEGTHRTEVRTLKRGPVGQPRSSCVAVGRAPYNRREVPCVRTTEKANDVLLPVVLERPTSLHSRTIDDVHTDEFVKGYTPTNRHTRKSTWSARNRTVAGEPTTTTTSSPVTKPALTSSGSKAPPWRIASIFTIQM